VGWTYGTLNPEGTFVYYYEDEGGNEIGHYVRIPYKGGVLTDITPDLPPYSSVSGIHPSLDGQRLVFDAALAGRSTLYALDAAANGVLSKPRRIVDSAKMIGNATISSDGGRAAISSTEKSQGLSFSVAAYDLNSESKSAELWDGDDCSTIAGDFSPVRGDTRMLARSDRSVAIPFGPLRPVRKDQDYQTD
jgi:Tol biopolymer transport system component